jgi:hypothetical protein
MTKFSAAAALSQRVRPQPQPRAAACGRLQTLLALAGLLAGHPVLAVDEAPAMRRVASLEVRVLGKEFRPDPTLFDLVPIGMVLWSDLFTIRPAPVRVNDKGVTELVEDGSPNCEIGVTVNKDELIKRTVDRYLKQNLMRQPKL